MLRIGEFSKLSMLTVKALRYYEKEGLLVPSSVDERTGYRLYETAQLSDAASIKALRQLGFSIDEVRSHISGAPIRDALRQKEAELRQRQNDISSMLSIIKFLLEDKEMKYQAVVKDIGECVVYSEERTLGSFAEITRLALESAQECVRLNPDIECVKPDYCFCEYLDGEYRETDIHARYSQAVTRAGAENGRIKFRRLPKTNVLCIYHRGPYDMLGEAYAYIYNYAKANGYKPSGFARECYIDGIWNKDDPCDWLTEIQLPIE